MTKPTCKACKWYDRGTPTRPDGLCHYGLCARDGEDVGPDTPVCYWFEEVPNAQKEEDQPQASAGD